MDGEVEEVFEAEEQVLPQEEAGQHEDESAEQQEEVESLEVFEKFLEEAKKLPTEELELRLSALKEVIDQRANEEDEELEQEEEGSERGDDEQEDGGAPLRGACKGKQRRKPTPAVIQKRTAAKERLIRKYFAEMESEMGATCWCYGYTTAAGKLRIGGAESMAEWMARKYRGEALKVHLSSTGEMQQALSRYAAIDLAVLLDILSQKQLSSLASGWFKRCEPSLKAFPLDKSKGSPPWWPEGVSFQQAASVRKPSLIQALIAAAKCICQNNTPRMAEQKLEKAFTTSQVLCNESLEVRAILHTVVKQAITRWQQSEEPTADQGGVHMGAGNQQAAGASTDTQGGQAAGADDWTGTGDGSRRAGANEDDGLLAGLSGQRKRRRACDIEERPFKCRHPDCSAHAGFTIRSGLDRHRRKKHPGGTSGVQEREGAGGGDGASAATAQEAEPTPTATGCGVPDVSAPTTNSPSSQADGDAANESAKEASGAPVDGTTTSAPTPTPEGAAERPAARTSCSTPAQPAAATTSRTTTGTTGEAPGRSPAPNDRAANGTAGPEKRPGARAPRKGTPLQSTAAGSGSSAEPRRPGERRVEPEIRETTAHAPKPATGVRSKRKPRAAVPDPLVPPLRPMDANRPQQTGRKRKSREPTGVYFETLEEYADYMINSGGEERARRGRGTSMRTFVKRRKEREAKLRASVPAEVARRAMIEAIEARPCKELYRVVGSDEFELLVTGSACEKKYVALYDVEPQILVEFAKASKIDHVGVEPWRLRWKIYQALDLEVLRDIGVLPENGDHLRE